MGNETKVTSKVDGNILTLSKLVKGKTATVTITDTNGNGIFTDDEAKYEGDSASLFTVAEIQKNTKAAKCEVKTTKPESKSTTASKGFDFSKLQAMISKYSSFMSQIAPMGFDTNMDFNPYAFGKSMVFPGLFAEMSGMNFGGVSEFDYSGNMDPTREAINSGKDPLVTISDGDEKDKTNKEPVVTTNDDGSTRTDYANGNAEIKFQDGSKNKLHTDSAGNRICERYDAKGILKDVTCYKKDGKSATVKARTGAKLKDLISEAVATPEARAAKKAEEAKKTETAEKDKKAKASAICRELYTAMEGIGTDDKKLKSAIAKINAGNVVAVLDRWAESSYASEMGDSSLIRLIGSETDGFSANLSHFCQDKTESFLTPIKEALRNHSKSEEAKDLATIVEANYNTSIRWDDSTAINNIQKLYELVKEEKGKKAE